MADPGGAAQRREAGGGGGRRLGWFLAGAVVGALGAVFLPGLAEPYLPGALRGERVEVAGVVEAKSSDTERLLLTVGSEAGAMLATFRDGIAEIDLLVSVGDSVLLSVDEYAPFVEDARISRVMKQRDWRTDPDGASVADGAEADGAEAVGAEAVGAEAVDTAAASTNGEGTPEEPMDTSDMMDTARTEAAEGTPPAPTP